MLLSFWLCVVLTAVPVVIGTDGSETYNTGFQEGLQGRIKRSLPTIIRNLLKNAKPYIVANTSRVYIKKGGVKEAEEDFRRLNLKKKEDFGDIKKGKIGTKVVELNPTGKYPSLKIISKGKTVDGKKQITEHKIIYDSNYQQRWK